MNNFKDMLRDSIASPVAQLMSRITTVGRVTGSDEINNLVNIQYVDKKGVRRNKDNVNVRLYGNGGDWFPAINDLVVIEESDSECTVVARHVGNYNMDVRAKMKLSQDIYSDSSGNAVGGNIF